MVTATVVCFAMGILDVFTRRRARRAWIRWRR
jgi:hypothetical protein